MIRANILIDNKNWKKYIKFPSLYINQKLEKTEERLNIFKRNNLNFTIYFQVTERLKN